MYELLHTLLVSKKCTDFQKSRCCGGRPLLFIRQIPAQPRPRCWGFFLVGRCWRRRKFRRSSAAVATSREGHHSPRSGREGQHQRRDRGLPTSITASEDGASATCVGVAPACKDLRSGPNKSEREPTSARSTDYGSGHLIPAFHGTGRTFSLLPSHPLDVSRSIDALGLVLERQSSRAKDGVVESKKVSIVFRAELTAGDERAARLSPKTRTPPESALGGGVSGTLIWWCTKGLLLRGLRFANSRTRPNLPHGTSCCGIFATLGEYFSPITLLGDFPVRMSQLEHVGGACAWVSRRFY